MKRYIGLLFILWTGGLIGAYYVVQKPGLLDMFTGLVDTLWTLLVAALLLFNAYGLGSRSLHFFRFDLQPSEERLLLAVGVGLGVLGMLGLFFAVLQLAQALILTTAQIIFALFFFVRGDVRKLSADFMTLASQVHLSFSQYSTFTKVAIGLTALLSFLLTLVPPFEAFDALLYHLTLPATILQHGGLYAINNSPFWFPGLTEHVYLWALGLGSERAAQIIHFSWTVFAVLLLWHWSVRVWEIEIGRKALLLVVTIPSLVMLASWAYADMALVYFAVAALYAVTRYHTSGFSAWLSMAGLASGFAMGIKYTSFVLPLACGLLLLFQTPLRKSISAAAQFCLVALAVASPWYIRNVVYMGNPVYPFVFGGRYWDDFLARWYADAGTGIGWNPLQILLLPLNVVLGVKDVTFFDGRIGMIFLILAPLSIWVLVRRGGRDSPAGWSLLAVGLFALLSFAAWTLGVISSTGLWQARLLFPAILPLVIPSALAWDSLKAFDTSKLRISYIFDVLVVVSILITLIDNVSFVVQRNPLAVAIGAQSGAKYIERINPSYAALMTLMEELPADAQVYSLFEPRSYGLPRPTQADPIVYNFAHDAFLYGTPAGIIRHWKAEHYTHLLVYERGLDFMIDSESYKFTPAIQQLLQETLGQLTLAGQTPDKTYSLYEIP